MFLSSECRSIQPHDIDNFISTELPDKHVDPELFDTVTSFMVHGPYGPSHPMSPCMKNDKCTKYFPKKFASETTVDKDGYPIYMRRDNGVFYQKGEFTVDNRFVVPYNRTLLLKYNAHINVE